VSILPPDSLVAAVALGEVDCCLASLGYGVPIRIALKSGDEEIRELTERLGVALDIELDLRTELTTLWDERAVAALEAGVELAESTGDVDPILSAFAAEFSGFGESSRAVIERAMGVAYDLDRDAVGRVAGQSFHLVDDAAKAWLTEDTTYWVGTAYDRQIGPKIAEVVRETMVEAGLDRRAAGLALEEAVGPLISGKRTKAYWELVAQSSVTRARGFGSVGALQASGATSYELMNPMDAATSGICLDLNGRVYRVEVAVETRDAMMAARSPEEAQALSPWVPESEIRGKSTAQLEEAGVVLPPFHGH